MGSNYNVLTWLFLWILLQKHHTTHRIPTTRPSLQRGESATLPRIESMGSRDRAKSRRPSDTTWGDICSHPRRKESTANLHRGTPQKRVHHALEEPLCSPLLLHQKERRETETSTRLSTPKRTHTPEPLPTTPHPRTYQQSAKCSTIL